MSVSFPLRKSALYGWIDYNADGIFDNATERASVAVPNGTTSGTVTLTFPTVPPGNQGSTYARFRLSTDSAAQNAVGAANDGEVEDYAVTIGRRVTGVVLNGGHPNRSGLASLTLQFTVPVTVTGPSSLQLWNHTTGAAVDISGATLQNNGSNAVTWDLSGLTLPDGYYTATLPKAEAGLAATHSSLFHVLAGDSRGNAQVDFGDFSDLANAFNTIGGPPYGPGDMNGDGAVDFTDFAILANSFNNLLSLPAMDFGDAAAPFPTVLPNAARHILGSGLILGATVDAEADGQPDAAAAGDGADEDGVTFATLQAGSNAAIIVTATVPGTAVLNAWIDFNADGDWDDAGEQIFVDQTLNHGTNNLTTAIPSGTSTGQVFARFRTSSVAGYSHSGLARDGEVEDYLVTIVSALSRSAGQRAMLDFWTGPVAGSSQTANISPAFRSLKPVHTEVVDLAITEVASARGRTKDVTEYHSSLDEHLVDDVFEEEPDLLLQDISLLR